MIVSEAQYARLNHVWRFSFLKESIKWTTNVIIFSFNLASYHSCQSFFLNTGEKTSLSLVHSLYLSLFDKCFIIETIVWTLRERRRLSIICWTQQDMYVCMIGKTLQGVVHHRSSLDKYIRFFSLEYKKKKTILFHMKHL